MERRDLFRAAGAAALLSFVPLGTDAAWAAVQAEPSAKLQELTAQRASDVGLFADAILPRTDTPSATDVGVVAWVDRIAAEYYGETDRRAFNDGMDALRALAMSGESGATGFDSAALARHITYVEKGDRRSPAGRGWWRLKALVIHGYFTSEVVQKQVLKTKIMPGRFDGNVTIPVKIGRSGS